jgi:hypothetical protein
MALALPLIDCCKITIKLVITNTLSKEVLTAQNFEKTACLHAAMSEIPQ